MIPIMQVPVLSTAHLSKTVAETMTAERSRYQWCAVAEWTYGYFVYLAELDIDAPQCLHDIYTWLTKNGFTDCWVRLDADADPVEELHTYNW